jgi:DNA polymerase-3 subunit epsilon
MPALAFVDLETTGATSSHDRITEIGIVEVDEDGSVREWQQLVNPGIRIPPFIEQLTGISNAMVADAPPFSAVAEETLQRLRGRVFIAHNARFDYGFLKAEFKRVGMPFRAEVLCTVKLSRSLYPEYTRHSLDALIERHRLAADARHRALADAQLIHQFWGKIRVDRSNDEIAAAIAAQNPPRVLPPQLDPGLADELPETPGVYLLHDAEDRVMWISKAGNIARQVFQHFAAKPRSTRDREVHERVQRISWRETTGEIGARLWEARLRHESPPTHQRPRKPVDVGPAPRWPFAGPAALRELSALHLVDQWRYLGMAEDPDAIPALLAAERPPFDAEIYAILSKYASLLNPLT